MKLQATILLMMFLTLSNVALECRAAPRPSYGADSGAGSSVGNGGGIGQQAFTLLERSIPKKLRQCLRDPVCAGPSELQTDLRSWLARWDSWEDTADLRFVSFKQNLPSGMAINRMPQSCAYHLSQGSGDIDRLWVNNDWFIEQPESLAQIRREALACFSVFFLPESKVRDLLPHLLAFFEAETIEIDLSQAGLPQIEFLAFGGVPYLRDSDILIPLEPVLAKLPICSDGRPTNRLTIQAATWVSWSFQLELEWVVNSECSGVSSQGKVKTVFALKNGKIDPTSLRMIYFP